MRTNKTVACRSQWIVKYSYGFSSPLNLYPTPQTVIMYRGLSGCGSIFSLSFLMNEERLLASGALSYPHTFSYICSLVKTCPLWLERKCNRSNSLAVRCILFPLSLVTVRVKQFISKPLYFLPRETGAVHNCLESHSTVWRNIFSSSLENSATSIFPHYHLRFLSYLLIYL